MRSIGAVTCARSDYSSFLPILRVIKADPELKLHLIVTGMHLSPDFGLTIEQIREDGFEIDERVEMLLSSDTPEDVAKSIGRGTIGFAESFSNFQPDILLLVGDRFELLSVASAALPFLIPIAHVSGGDVTEGSTDNQVRHAISKMSHLHFVSMAAHARRLRQMGEESWRIFTTGDPALDLIHQTKFLDRAELSKSFDLELEPPVVLITFHPTTLGSSSAEEEVGKLLGALGRIQGTLILTYPNADAHGRIIIEQMRSFVAEHSNARLFFNLGQLKYYSLMEVADVMVGNSSSGIWEAPSFQLPVINIGERQKGRLRAENVIDVDGDANAIYEAIEKALSPTFRASLSELQNPYGSGQAASTIVESLKKVQLGTKLLQKRFIDNLPER